MITRKEAEAYEKVARAEERLAVAHEKMYGALSKVLKKRPGPGDKSPQPPKLAEARLKKK